MRIVFSALLALVQGVKSCPRIKEIAKVPQHGLKQENLTHSTMLSKTSRETKVLIGTESPVQVDNTPYPSPTPNSHF